MGDNPVHITVFGKTSKNCATCLGFHPAPFGKSCAFQGEKSRVMSESEGDTAESREPSKSPLPSREEHLKKLITKEELNKDKLEEARRVKQLEHQLATLRISNQDIVRDIDENDMVASSLGVHSGTTSFRGSRQEAAGGGSASGKQRQSRGGAGGGTSPVLPAGLRTIREELSSAEGPEFLTDTFTFAIDRSTCVGAEVGRVGVVCGPTADNTLTFSLAAADGAGDDMKYFQMDPESGRINLKVGLDESKKVYRLEVVATDSGTPSRSSTATVNIHVVCEDN